MNDTLVQEKARPPVAGDDVVIRIEHLKKAFGDNEVLKDISLELHRGENIVVLGRSGQGKSVTIQCVAGLLEPDEGNLEVLGKEVKELSEDELKELRSKLGFLFQSGALYDSMTVRENLMFPLTRVLKMKDEAEMEKWVTDVLESVGLEEAIDKYPADLSGGMRKRVGLARTLILRPEIILYDEPTTGLDPITSREISELIVKLQEKYKTSSIIITHDMACARIVADRIAVMNEGAFIATGTYDELSKSPDELINNFFK
ncbi:ABC transporter ATP-binding protein [Chitinophaga ginsengisoli]|uniref:Phospholipid/cholesterol/gamma-HCH transport system ATP-binding protein n=1 Tax=Chitinophaga ginsengisoli TaxID=363837 RepID=A0A2P8G4G6_9BACT|nr:ATP-binding cassette domain-containing protein [Chitinophaga ginsengisoli]PSL28872.1 phospholipid/cholesterol/gamma-HCH transport system ATP-binding protein [Chitinophaga ginsengisoli]